MLKMEFAQMLTHFAHHTFSSFEYGFFSKSFSLPTPALQHKMEKKQIKDTVWADDYHFFVGAGAAAAKANFYVN